MKLLLRILALPFVIGILAIKLMHFGIGMCINFLRFGGEFMCYSKLNDSATIQQVYHEVKKIVKEETQT